MVTVGKKRDFFAVCFYSEKYSFLPGCTVIVDRDMWMKL